MIGIFVCLPPAIAKYMARILLLKVYASILQDKNNIFGEKRSIYGALKFKVKKSGRIYQISIFQVFCCFDLRQLSVTVFGSSISLQQSNCYVIGCACAKITLCKGS
jgi:hypothetical protein